MPLLRLVEAEHRVGLAATLGAWRLNFCSVVCTAQKVAAVIMNGSLNLAAGFARTSRIPAIPTAAAAFWQRYK